MDKYKLFNNALAADGQEWMKVNLIMIQKLGIKEAIVARQFLQIQNYFARKGQLTNTGTFFATYEYIADATGLTRKQVILAVTNLENVGLLKTEVTKQNNVKRKWYKVDKDVYDEFLKDGDGNICANVEDDQYWIVYNKRLAKKYGPVDTIIFSDMYTTYYNAKVDNSLVELLWAKKPMTKLAQKLKISRTKVVNKYIPELKEAGLIDLQTMGWDNATHFMIMEENLAEELGLKEEIYEQRLDTQVERITKAIIAKAKLYGEDWHYKFYEYASIIEERLADGISEDELTNIIDYVYDYYQKPKNQKYYKTNFNFKYIYGKGRCKEQWLSMQKGEEATRRILFKVQQITNNQFVWDVSEKKINLVRHRLENGIKEKDLVDFIESRYNYLKENDCKYTNFTIEKLLADENEKHIKAFIKSKTPEAKSRDGVKSISYTKAEIEEFRRRAAEIEADGGQGVF